MNVMKKWNEVNEKIHWWDLFIGLVGGFVFIFCLLYFKKSIFSGYHFVDDHEMVYFKYLHDQGESYFNILFSVLKTDLTWRFRPFYYVERVALSLLFGGDLLQSNIWTAIKGVISFLFLYLSARNLKCDILFSGLFSCVVVLGTQFEIWYRCANQENTGLLLMAVVIFLVSYVRKNNKYNSKSIKVIISFLIVLMVLTKESFLLALPFIIAISFLDEMYSFEGNDKNLFERIKIIFKRNSAFYIFTILLFAICIIILVKFVGVDNVSYAGFHKEDKIDAYLNMLWLSVKFFLKGYIIVFVSLMIINIISLIIERKNKERDKYKTYKIFMYFVVLFLAMVVQVIAHAKSMLGVRYLIPWTVFYAGVAVVITFYLTKNQIVLRCISFTILSIFVVTQFYISYEQTLEYKNKGISCVKTLEHVKSVSNSEDIIIGCFDEEELNVSTERWLETQGFKSVFSYSEKENKVINYIKLSNDSINDVDLKDAKVIVCYSWCTDDIIELAGMEKEKVDVFNTDYYSVIQNNN